MTPEEANSFLERTISNLSEHFDSVQIVATRLRPDGQTEWHGRGSGNWFSRKAACMEFVERDQAQTIARSIQQVNEGDS